MNDKRAPGCHPYIVSSPLWSRAPSRDENGRPFIDFMMIIPGLKTASDAVIESHLQKIRKSLKGFENSVAYVDLNIKLNLLWVSARQVPGISKVLMQAIQREIPQAKIVAVDFNPETFADKPRRSRLASLGQRVKKRLLMLTSGSAN